MKYFECLCRNGFGTEFVAIIATEKNNPRETDYSFATGFNGCRIISYQETSQECYRRQKRQFYKISGDI